MPGPICSRDSANPTDCFALECATCRQKPIWVHLILMRIISGDKRESEREQISDVFWMAADANYTKNVTVACQKV